MPRPALSEILGLRWESVDLLGGTLLIERSSVGKHADDVKTEASEATLPLHPSLVRVLMEWRQAAPVIGGWLFGSPYTDRPYHRDSLAKDYLRPAGRAIGLSSLGWHDFRHTYRHMLRELDFPLEIQQKLMRHANIGMTLHYGVGGPVEEKKRAANTAVIEHIANSSGSHRPV